MTITRMEPEHVPEVAAIEAEVFSMPWTRRGFLEALQREEALFYVALEEKRVVGYCGIYLAADEGEITNVAVRPECRRRGIASGLVRQVQKEAQKRGASRIYLEVRQSNEPAIRLYTRAGFHEAGVRKNFYQKPPEDAKVLCCEV